MRSVLLLSALLVPATPGFAETHPEGLLDRGLAQFHDPSGQLDIEAISSPSIASRFEELPGPVPARRQLEGALWVRFDVPPIGPESLRRYLRVEWPRLDELTLYSPVQGGFHADRSGSQVSFSDRPEWGPDHVFPIDVDPHAPKTVFLRIRTRFEFRCPLRLVSAQTHTRRRTIQLVETGGFAGMVMGLAVFAVLIFLRIRHPMYLYFSLHMMGFLGWWLLARGWGAGLDAGEATVAWLFALVFDLWLLARLAFTRSLLNLEVWAPRMNQLLYRIQVFGIPLLLLSQILAPEAAPTVAAVVPLILLGLELYAGIVALRAGSRLAAWYLVATTALMAGLFLASLTFSGIVELSILAPRTAIRLGILGELFGLAYVLAESIREVTRDRQLALRQVEIERLGALQGLVAGVTHELNTPLGALRSSAQSMETACARLSAAAAPEDKESRRALRAIPRLTEAVLAGAERIDEVVRSLKRFAQLDEAEEQIYDLHEGLESALTLLAPKIGPAVRVDSRYEGPRHVRCRPAAMNQVFMSILENAVQAVGEAGTLRVITSSQAGAFQLRIEDDGVGMSPGQLATIFSPKLGARGTRVKMGMGLSSAKGVVEQLGGQIDVQSVLGEGTSVTIELPTERVEEGSRPQPSEG